MPSPRWFLVLLAALSAAPAGRGAEPVAAVVNGEPIYLSELTDLLLRRYGPKVLDELIARRVLYQAMKEAGWQPDREELRFAIEEEEKNVRRLYGAGATLEATCRRELGLSRQEYIERVIKVRLFVRHMAAGRHNPSEAELVRHYSEHRERFAEPPRLRLAHIFFAGVDARGRRRWEEARRKAEKCLEYLSAGRDFAELARRMSEDRETAGEGGELGFVEPEGFRWGPKVLEAAGRARPGEVVGPVRSLFGYHVLKVLERIPGYLPDYQRVRSLVLADYLNERTRLEAELYTSDLVRRARIERRLDDILGLSPAGKGKEEER